MRRFAIFLCALTLCGSSYLLIKEIKKRDAALAPLPTTFTSNLKEPIPVSIEIAALNLQLPILVKTSPELIDNGVVYLSTSTKIGESGNGVLYGHNFPNLLGRINSLQKGDEILITLSDGSKKIFATEFSQEVTPDQTHVLARTPDKRITLITCSGLFDSKRLVLVATLKDPTPQSLEL